MRVILYERWKAYSFFIRSRVMLRSHYNIWWSFKKNGNRQARALNCHKLREIYKNTPPILALFEAKTSDNGNYS